MNKLVFFKPPHLTHTHTSETHLKRTASEQWEGVSVKIVCYRKCENVILALSKQLEIVIRTLYYMCMFEVYSDFVEIYLLRIYICSFPTRVKL